MSTLADKERFREKVGKLIDHFSTPIRERSFLGAEPGPTLEHVTRRHFIDPFLRALGWNLSQLNEEMIEEARTRGETTLRLDYLGVNQQTRIPVLIVEAKSWESPFVER
jgi:predicted type IV restriction endonuclease